MRDAQSGLPVGVCFFVFRKRLVAIGAMHVRVFQVETKFNYLGEILNGINKVTHLLQTESSLPVRFWAIWLALHQHVEVFHRSLIVCQSEERFGAKVVGFRYLTVEIN